MEFNQIMKKFREEAEERGDRLHLEGGEHWLYSWDKDKIHKGADLAQMGINKKHRFTPA
jgi:hypothetical protein